MRSRSLSWGGGFGLLVILTAVVWALGPAGCDSVNPASTNVDITAGISSSTSPILEDQTFVFADGGVLDSALDGQDVAITFNNVQGSSGEFTMSTGSDSATGTAVFGSCTFQVSSSTITGIDAGDEISVDCNLRVVATGAKVGRTNSGTISLVLINNGNEEESDGVDNDEIDIAEDGEVSVSGTDTGEATPLPTGSGGS